MEVGSIDWLIKCLIDLVFSRCTVTLPTESNLTKIGEMKQQNKMGLHNKYIFNTNKIKSNICTVRIGCPKMTWSLRVSCSALVQRSFLSWPETLFSCQSGSFTPGYFSEAWLNPCVFLGRGLDAIGIVDIQRTRQGWLLGAESVRGDLGGIEAGTCEPNRGSSHCMSLWVVDTCRGRTRIQSRTKMTGLRRIGVDST